MAGLQIPIRGGRIKLRHRSRARNAERNGEVPAVFIGPLVISWWSKDALQYDAKVRGQMTQGKNLGSSVARDGG